MSSYAGQLFKKKKQMLQHSKFPLHTYSPEEDIQAVQTIPAEGVRRTAADLQTKRKEKRSSNLSIDIKDDRMMFVISGLVWHRYIVHCPAAKSKEQKKVRIRRVIFWQICLQSSYEEERHTPEEGNPETSPAGREEAAGLRNTEKQ